MLREHEDSNVRTYLPGELICCESLSRAARRDTKRKRRRVARPNPITRPRTGTHEASKDVERTQNWVAN